MSKRPSQHSFRFPLQVQIRFPTNVATNRQQKRPEKYDQSPYVVSLKDQHPLELANPKNREGDGDSYNQVASGLMPKNTHLPKRLHVSQANDLVESKDTPGNPQDPAVSQTCWDSKTPVRSYTSNHAIPNIFVDNNGLDFKGEVRNASSMILDA